MRILMINSNRHKHPWPVMPFGLGCVAAAVERAGHATRLLDLCFSEQPEADIRAAVKRFLPDVIAVSVRNIDNSAGFNTEFLLDDVRDRVIGPCRQMFSGPVVIGGPAVGVNGPELLAYLDVDMGIRGDGEMAVVELLRRLETRTPLAGMPGLIRREGGRIVEDNEPMRVPNLDELAMDRVYDHVDVAAYRRYGSPLQVQTKRGCALSCSYCTYNRIEGRRWRLRDPKKVADDIERTVERTGVRHVEFTDSTFNYPLDHCKAVLRAIIARKLNLRLRTMGLNPGAMDEELVELMYAAGFREVDLGAESLCDTTLRGLGKRFSKTDVLNAIALLRRRKIAMKLFLLMGGPGETPATARETLDAANAAMDPMDLVCLGIGLRIYKGTPIADRMTARHSVSRADGFLRPVTFEPDGWSLTELKALVKREAWNRPNYYMYDEDDVTPLPAQRLATWLTKNFAPDQPAWRQFILMRRVRKALGIAALKRIAYGLKNRYSAPVGSQQQVRPADWAADHSAGSVRA